MKIILDQLYEIPIIVNGEKTYISAAHGMISDVHSLAQSHKPAKAEPKKAKPAWAIVMASQGPWLRLQVEKAVSCSLSCGFC
jgi:hypothetical protein